jgi:integrase
MDDLAAQPARIRKTFKNDLELKGIVRAAEDGRWRDEKTKCLYFESHDGRSFHWVFEPLIKGRQYYLSYGGYPETPLSEARDRATQDRLTIRQGKDPRAERKAVQALAKALTIGDCIKQYAALQTDWSVSAQRQFKPHRLLPVAMLSKPVLTITKADIVEALAIRTPNGRPRIRRNLEIIFDWAIDREFRKEANPVPRILKNYFQDTKLKTKHHPPMPVNDVPLFMRELRARENDIPARCLELQILTGVRPGEARVARWSEVDFQNRTWNVPCERMKMRRFHRVPLSEPAMALLRLLYENRFSELVFPPEIGKFICAEAVAQRIPTDRYLTPKGEVPHCHGFRSSFKMWMRANHVDHDVSEKCLAHEEKNKVVAAYLQDDLFDLRRPVMEQWAAFLDGAAS